VTAKGYPNVNTLDDSSVTLVTLCGDICRLQCEKLQNGLSFLILVSFLTSCFSEVGGKINLQCDVWGNKEKSRRAGLFIPNVNTFEITSGEVEVLNRCCWKLHLSLMMNNQPGKKLIAA
jgi:hypothetical protein